MDTSSLNKKQIKKNKKLFKKKEALYHFELVKKQRENLKQEKVTESKDYIVLKDVNKIFFNNFHVVKHIDLSIREGEFLVVVGPSGCGKSTLLRLVAGLEDITYGDIYIDGLHSNRIPPKDRSIAMVFQTFALYPNLNVYENLAFPLKLKHVPKAEIHEKVLKASKILDIEDILNYRISNLSGGEKQRVALGRALVKDAKIFLMDEPLSNLDPGLRDITREEIKKLHSKINSTSIYVTHDQKEAMLLADTLVVLNNGEIQQVGNVKQIYHNPKNLFVASFFGEPSMTLLTCHIDKAFCTFENNKIKLSSDDLFAISSFYQNKVSDVKKSIEDIESKINKRNEELSNLNVLKVKLRQEKYALKLDNKIIDLEEYIKIFKKDYETYPSELTLKKIQKLEQDLLDLNNKKNNIQKVFDDEILKVLQSEKENEEKKVKKLEEFCKAHKKDFNSAVHLLALKKERQHIEVQEKDDLYLILQLELKKKKQLLQQYEATLEKEVKDMILGIRSEDFDFDTSNGLEDEVIELTIEDFEQNGNESFVHSSIGKNKIIIKRNSNTPIKINERIKVVIKKDRVHLFDPISEETII